MDQQPYTFLSVIENNKGIIYKIANSYSRTEEDRKDLIQEILIQLWRSFDRYDYQFKLSTWMYRIALNVSISFYRKHRVRHERTREISASIIASLPADDAAENDPNLELLQKFINELNEIDKALTILYLDGKSQKEISEILGITPTNISTRIGRIKDKLKQKFSLVKNQIL